MASARCLSFQFEDWNLIPGSHMRGWAWSQSSPQHWGDDMQSPGAHWPATLVYWPVQSSANATLSQKRHGWSLKKDTWGCSLASIGAFTQMHSNSYPFAPANPRIHHTEKKSLCLLMVATSHHHKHRLGEYGTIPPGVRGAATYRALFLWPLFIRHLSASQHITPSYIFMKDLLSELHGF